MLIASPEQAVDLLPRKFDLTLTRMKVSAMPMNSNVKMANSGAITILTKLLIRKLQMDEMVFV